MIELLKTIAEEMTKLDINYDFMTWKQTPVPYPYSVGQYFIEDYSEESHTLEAEFLITAWDRNKSYMRLVELDEKLKNHFRDFRKISNKTGMSIVYKSSYPEYDDDDELKKLEVRLEVVLWEGE